MDFSDRLPVYENVHHPAYKRVRRCWVMMAQLEILDCEPAYEQQYGVAWDACMADALINHDLTEAQLSRMIVGRMLKINLTANPGDRRGPREDS
jgi:hypothetical protein